MQPQFINEQINAALYDYEIIPLLEPFNEYFYVKTDNPDPESFRFVEESSRYLTTEQTGTKGLLKPVEKRFADVKYQDAETGNVNGGYLFSSDGYVDGGTLNIQQMTARHESTIYNLSTGKSEPYITYDYTVTDAQAEMGTVKDVYDYLIDTYTNDNQTFFEKMDALQKGMDQITLYYTAYVQGDLVKVENQYWGLSTSPHVDQTFYIQKPYTHTASTPMLCSYLYPYILDSIGFPSMMGRLAKNLDDSATWQWNSNYHWLIDVTWNGETKTYGGAGEGGGHALTKDQVTKIYSFDGSSTDQTKVNDLAGCREQICYYGTLPKIEETYEDELTWNDIYESVGEEAWLRVYAIDSIYGSSHIAFTYFAKMHGAENPSYFSDAWVDGRYINRYEYFSKGDTLEDHPNTTIVLKDVKIKVPEPESGNLQYSYRPLSERKEYDANTGIWKGYMKFYYIEETDTWQADIYDRLSIYDSASWTRSKIEDKEFVDACTLTRAEVEALQVDRNANTDPAVYMIYDLKSEPGVWVGK